MRWPISSVRLQECALRLSSGPDEKCTLLPFFNAGGRVQRVLVLKSQTSEIRWFSPAEVRVRIGLWGPLKLGTEFPTLCALEGGDREWLTDLWHYDPWSQLAARDASQGARARLWQASNTAGRFAPKLGQVLWLRYSRDLTRVLWLVCKKSQSVTWKYFRSAWLPERQAVEVPPRNRSRTTAWQLAPFWQCDRQD